MLIKDDVSFSVPFIPGSKGILSERDKDTKHGEFDLVKCHHMFSFGCIFLMLHLTLPLRKNYVNALFFSIEKKQIIFDKVNFVNNICNFYMNAVLQ